MKGNTLIKTVGLDDRPWRIDYIKPAGWDSGVDSGQYPEGCLVEDEDDLAILIVAEAAKLGAETGISPPRNKTVPIGGDCIDTGLLGHQGEVDGDLDAGRGVNEGVSGSLSRNIVAAPPPPPVAVRIKIPVRIPVIVDGVTLVVVEGAAIWVYTLYPPPEVAEGIGVSIGIGRGGFVSRRPPDPLPIFPTFGSAVCVSPGEGVNLQIAGDVDWVARAFILVYPGFEVICRQVGLHRT